MKKVNVLVIFLLMIGFINAQENKLIIERVDSGFFPKLRVFVRVSDGDQTIKGLTSSNFQIRAEDKNILEFKSGSVFSSNEWIAIALTIDTSGSMSGEPIKNARDAAISFVGKTGVQDRITLVKFSTNSSIVVEPTKNKSAVIAGVNSLIAKGNTSLYDSIKLSIEKLLTLKSSRKVLIVLTDGKDTSSKTKESEIFKILEKSKSVIYSIGLGKNVNGKFLSEIADKTSGKYFNVIEPGALSGIYNEISKDLSNSYFLEFRVPIESNEALSRVHEISIFATVNEDLYRTNTKFFPANTILGGDTPSSIEVNSTESLNKKGESETELIDDNYKVANLNNIDKKNGFDIKLLILILLIGAIISIIIGFALSNKIGQFQFILIFVLVEIIFVILFFVINTL